MAGIEQVLYKNEYLASIEIWHFRKRKTNPSQCYISAICGRKTNHIVILNHSFRCSCVYGTIKNLYRITSLTAVAGFVIKSAPICEFLFFVCLWSKVHRFVIFLIFSTTQKMQKGADPWMYIKYMVSILYGLSGTEPPFFIVGLHFERGIGRYTYMYIKIWLFRKRDASSNQCRIWNYMWSLDHPYSNSGPLSQLISWQTKELQLCILGTLCPN